MPCLSGTDIFLISSMNCFGKGFLKNRYESGVIVYSGIFKMGSECIGRHKNHDNHPKITSNASSQQTTPPKAYRLSLRPSLVQFLSPPSTQTLYDVDESFEIPKQWQIYKEYRYQDYVEARTVSASYPSKKNLLVTEDVVRDRWLMCSSVDRFYWQQRGAKTAIINTNSYVMDEGHQIQ